MSDWTGVPEPGHAMRAEAERLHAALQRVADAPGLALEARERGVVLSVGEGVARVGGLATAEADELLRFPGERMGTVFNLDVDEIGVILLDPGVGLEAGDRVERTDRVLDVPVGEALLGRVVDGLGRPLDGLGPVRAVELRRVERPSPGILDRAPVHRPLQTGIRVVDALVPVGRGQRELIVGDRETGKTSIAVDTILNQEAGDVLCLYCAIGQRSSAVAEVIAELRAHDAMAYSAVVVAGGDDPPGLQFVAPYAAMSMGEFFMEQGHDVLVVYDDLTRHARAYRELSLLLRRPPGREAYPGDIFHIHARLLERATQLSRERGGGSLTVLPVVETQAQNISAYIPTNLISITDGQIYLSPALFQKGVLPAVDVGRSVSRVGGDAQLRAYRAVAGELRLAYAQFHELERFSRFATQLDEATRDTLEHGRRVREIFLQPRSTPMDVPAQVAVLLAASSGMLDDLPVEQVSTAAERIAEGMQERGDFTDTVRGDEALERSEKEAVASVAGGVVERLLEQV